MLGLLSGGVTALIALSFVLIYKGTGVVNFAVGEVMMLGAYLYYAAAVTFELPHLGWRSSSRWCVIGTAGRAGGAQRCCGPCRASLRWRC